MLALGKFAGFPLPFLLACASNVKFYVYQGDPVRLAWALAWFCAFLATTVVILMATPRPDHLRAGSTGAQHPVSRLNRMLRNAGRGARATLLYKPGPDMAGRWLAQRSAISVPVSRGTPSERSP